MVKSSIRRPVPILIPYHEVGIQLGLVFGEGQAIALEDGLIIYLLHRDAALHAGHGADELGEAVVAVHILGREKILLASDARNLKHRADVGFGVVLLGRCPAGDDVPHREHPTLRIETLVVGLQDAPGSPLAIGHCLELYKTLVCLFFRSTLPTVGRVTDV